MTRIVILGGAGFLGSHLCDVFLNKGSEVVAIDNFSTGSIENLKHLLKRKTFSLIEGDICDPIQVKGKIDLIMNFASPASPKAYMQMPLETLRAGSLGTENAALLALENDCRLLMASTSEVYGDPLVSPQSESYFGNVNPNGIRSCYDEAKRYSEALLMAYKRTSGLRLGIARIFNTYGPRLHPYDGRVISTLIRQAINDEDLTIHGDGTQTRSFCYVDDLIRGIVALAESDELGPINLGNDADISVIELACLILEINKSKNRIVFEPRMNDDPKQRRPDLSLAKTRLNWTPETSLEVGLSKTLQWFKK